MKDHEAMEHLLPLYAAGRLDPYERTEVEAHLSECADCREDLALWQEVGEEIVHSSQTVEAPGRLAQLAWLEVKRVPPLQVGLRRTALLLQAQVRLVHKELWPAAALLLMLGVVVALIAERADVLTFLIPLIAAGGMALAYGPQNDPAFELVQSTPTSPWKVLLARLALVSTYNLLLALAGSLVLLAVLPADMPGTLILSWLGPMAFLSTLALLLSMWTSVGNAVTIAAALWAAPYILSLPSLAEWGSPPLLAGLQPVLWQFWHAPVLLLLCSLPLLGLALLTANRPGRMLSTG